MRFNSTELHPSSDILRAAILDKDEACSNRVARQLSLYYPEISLQQEFHSLEETLKQVKDQQLDVLFIEDQYFNDPAIGLLDQYRFEQDYFQVIVTSRDKSHMSEALEMGAAGYIQKPIDPKVLILCMERVKKLMNKRSCQSELPSFPRSIYPSKNGVRMVTVPDRNGFKMINADQIQYLKADGAYVHIFLEKERYMVSRRLKDYDFLMDVIPLFRTHRSYLVNLNHINHYKHEDGGYIVMNNGHSVTLSRDKKKSFFTLCNYQK